MTEFKKFGTFLEIGCGHPKDHSNTWLLEKIFGWSGHALDRENAYDRRYHSVKKSHWPQDPVAFELLPFDIQVESNQANTGLTSDLYTSSDWNSRVGTSYHKVDAVEFDYGILPGKFDYLQIDLDSALDHLTLLKNLASTKTFGVITFEHDVFSGSPESLWCQQESRRCLQSLGYVLMANNVTVEPHKGHSHVGGPMFFEDWWANPDLISGQIIERFRLVDAGTEPKYYTHVLFA